MAESVIEYISNYTPTSNVIRVSVVPAPNVKVALILVISFLWVGI